MCQTSDGTSCENNVGMCQTSDGTFCGNNMLECVKHLMELFVEITCWNVTNI